MENVLNKINNHKLLNEIDIIKFFKYEKKELKLDDKALKSLKFCNNKKLEYMWYSPLYKSVCVTNKYKNLCIEDYLSQLEESNETGDYITGIDFYNLSLLHSIMHEIYHAYQYKNFLDNDLVFTASIDLMNSNPNLYYKHWGSFFIEYTANVFAMNELLMLIDKKYINNIDFKTLSLLNSWLAYFILEGYGISNEEHFFFKYKNFDSPLDFINLNINKIENMSKKELNKLKSLIETLKLEGNTSSNLDNLLMGNTLDTQTILYLIKVFRGKIKTDNLLKGISVIDKNKEKTLSIKK